MTTAESREKPGGRKAKARGSPVAAVAVQMLALRIPTAFRHPGFVILLAMAALSLCGCTKSERQHLTAQPAPQPAVGVFFVATNGNDQWSGRLPAPDWRRSDGPFATLPRALQAICDLKRRSGGALQQPVTVWVRNGTHFLREPLVFLPGDSGTASASVTFAAYPGERPILSGGRRINGWKSVTIDGRNLWAARIPEVRDGTWYFRQLWVNGERRTRARHPNRGYLRVAEVLGPTAQSSWTEGHTQFRFAAGDLQAWPSVTNAEVIVMNRWVESRVPVVGVEEKERVVAFSKRTVFQLAKDDPYYIEHAFELLDAPGEWYLDRASGILYYAPLPGENPEQAEVIAPALTQLVRFEGRPEAGQFIEHVAFRGLTFSHAEWYFPDGFDQGKDKPNVWPAPKPSVGGFAQAAVGVPGAVWGEGARDCAFENCRFAHVGTYGLQLARGCRRNRIVGCEFFDLGAGGIKLGETRLRTDEAEVAGENQVTDCHIHDGGKMFHSAIGIWIGQSPNNRIAHNLIHDFYYTGISIGWTWGYGPALASNNIVEFNHIHHIGAKSNGDGPILSDMGGIYTLGGQPGTTIRNNLWHDIAGLRYGGWGIYFDEGSSHIVAESNLVYRTTHGGFHQHYGKENIVRNNVFAFARDHQVQRSRAEEHKSFFFQTNIVYFNSGVLLGGNWSGDNFQLDWNVYWDARTNATPATMRFAGATLEQWRQRGHDLHSLVADPLFVAPQEDDFRLRPGSPALQLGFQPINIRQVGPRESRHD